MVSGSSSLPEEQENPLLQCCSHYIVAYYTKLDFNFLQTFQVQVAISCYLISVHFRIITLFSNAASRIASEISIFSFRENASFKTSLSQYLTKIFNTLSVM